MTRSLRDPRSLCYLFPLKQVCLRSSILSLLVSSVLRDGSLRMSDLPCRLLFVLFILWVTSPTRLLSEGANDFWGGQRPYFVRGCRSTSVEKGQRGGRAPNGVRDVEGPSYLNNVQGLTRNKRRCRHGNVHSKEHRPHGKREGRWQKRSN